MTLKPEQQHTAGPRTDEQIAAHMNLHAKIEQLEQQKAYLLEALQAVYQDIELQNVKGGSDELNLMVHAAIAKATNSKP